MFFFCTFIFHDDITVTVNNNRTFHIIKHRLLKQIFSEQICIFTVENNTFYVSIFIKHSGEYNSWYISKFCCFQILTDKPAFSRNHIFKICTIRNITYHFSPVIYGIPLFINISQRAYIILFNKCLQYFSVFLIIKGQSFFHHTGNCRNFIKLLLYHFIDQFRLLLCQKL